jgi:hypothetical protein
MHYAIAFFELIKMKLNEKDNETRYLCLIYSGYDLGYSATMFFTTVC